MSGIAVSAPFAPLLLVIGALILFGKIRPSRLGLVATAGVAGFSYMYWRIAYTIPWSGSFAEMWWPVTCLAIEVAGHVRCLHSLRFAGTADQPHAAGRRRGSQVARAMGG